MSTIKKEPKSHFIKLLGKEDFNVFKPVGLSFLEAEFFRMEAHNHDGPYNFSLVVYDVEEYNQDEYCEGQLEGNAIACDGDHFSENGSGELRIILKPENVHWLRFFVSPFRFQAISHFEFYEPSGNLLKRIEGRSGWVDYKVPLQDMKTARIARVSIYFKIDFRAVVVDSFELGQWEQYP
ncbi:hypothetical protein NZ35_01165 [Pseudomonas chlororaphis]|uniref:Uncharacterized protein n=1 Tax=Pseudomonas chlororaphis TaxID=587753 RepID=A0A0A6DGD1_9PSED|nr:hypothetical protein NZ35_01165 [Pseudomonas chlororaphis]